MQCSTTASFVLRSTLMSSHNSLSQEHSFNFHQVVPEDPHPLSQSPIMTNNNNNNSPSGLLGRRRARAAQRLNWTSSSSSSTSSSSSSSSSPSSTNATTAGSSDVVQSARRALFVDKNNINREENLNMVKKQLATLIENDCKRWNFDFVKGCPWPDGGNQESTRYEWKPVIPLSSSSSSSSSISPIPSSRVPKRLLPQAQLLRRLEVEQHQKGHSSGDQLEVSNLPSENQEGKRTVRCLFGHPTRKMDTGCSPSSSDTNNNNNNNNNDENNQVQLLMNEKSHEISVTMKKTSEVHSNRDLKASKLVVKSGSKRQKTIPEYFTRVLKKQKTNGQKEEPHENCNDYMELSSSGSSVGTEDLVEIVQKKPSLVSALEPAEVNQPGGTKYLLSTGSSSQNLQCTKVCQTGEDP